MKVHLIIVQTYDDIYVCYHSTNKQNRDRKLKQLEKEVNETAKEYNEDVQTFYYKQTIDVIRGGR